MDQAPAVELSSLAIGTSELTGLLGALPEAGFDAFARAFPPVGDARRIFFSGQGRSGLSAQMVAMRFMHLGYDAHFVGEPTAPSVRSGDTLVIVSGSGKTPVSVGFARIAKEQGARVLLVTHQAESELRTIADDALVLPARSRQFGGTLFEQAALVVLDAVVLELTRGLPDAYAVMLHNHTNLQ